MKRGVLIGGFAALLVAAAGAWYVASPGMAMAGLRDAALAADEDALRDRVDFPAVRESFKAELKGQMARKIAGSPEAGGLEMIGSMMAMGMIDNMVDGLVTPQGVAAMVKRGHFQDQSAAAKAPEEQPVEWVIERKGLDRFTAAPAVPDPKAPALNFVRDGLGWKLETIDMPDDLLAGA